MKRTGVTRLLAWAVAALAVMLVLQHPSHADEPGAGKTVKPARATWDTGWFQLEVYIRALEELGYEVARPTTLDNPPFYKAVAQGDIDFWVNGWFPLHNPYRKHFEGKARAVGYVAETGTRSGYLIDKKTHEKYGITNIADMKKPEIRKLFDRDGNGKADLVACPPGWGCELVISNHIEAYELGDVIDPIKASYNASMADTIARFKAGKPVLYFSWRPNWTMGLLRPGEDVVWIEVPFPALPEKMKEYEEYTTIKGVRGCVNDPCRLGFPGYSIRPVANNEFLAGNPAVERLFEVASVPLSDVSAQNAKMFNGEDRRDDLIRHAEDWIADNRDTFEGWLAEARKAAE